MYGTYSKDESMHGLFNHGPGTRAHLGVGKISRSAIKLIRIYIFICMVLIDSEVDWRDIYLTCCVTFNM